MGGKRYSIKQLDYNYAGEISAFAMAELDRLSKHHTDLKALRVFLKYVDTSFVKQNLQQGKLQSWACFLGKRMVGLLLAGKFGEIIILTNEKEEGNMVARALFYTMYHYRQKFDNVHTMKAQVPKLGANLYKSLGFTPTGEKSRAGCIAMEYTQKKHS